MVPAKGLAQLITTSGPNLVKSSFTVIAFSRMMVDYRMRRWRRVMVRTLASVPFALCSARGAPQAPADQIAAYGQVSPGEGVVTLSARYYLNSPPVVEELLVKVGDHVARHQELATTDSRTLAETDIALGKAHLAAAEQRLRALTAGSKNQDTAAQQALIESLLAEARAEKAKKPPDTAAGKLEAQAREDAADAKVRMSQHQLQAMQEVRPADVAVAQAEVEEAKAAALRAEALLAFTEVRAPFDGEILKILSYPGAEATRGLLEIGATQTMVIKVELNVADASRIKIGSRATIKSAAFQGYISGTLTQIDPLVERSKLVALSTYANVDREIIEATITPEAPEKLAGLTGAEVTVTITSDSATK